uniref:Uncharacterized protein n=1 Tax=Arundo donax TaxID=35708 RepID=A0A0A9DS43_ARUDO
MAHYCVKQAVGRRGVPSNV